VISNLSSISDLTLSNQSFGQTTSGKLHSFSSIKLKGQQQT